MATDIVQGLFGLTPEAYQAEQNRQAQAEALRFAQLDPFQQANYGLYMGGRQLGGLVGQALGAQDPQLQMISKTQSLLRGINPADEKSIEAGIQEAAQFNPQLAFSLKDTLQQLRLNKSKIEAEAALTEQRLREKAAADPFEQLVRSGKATPASLAKYKISKDPADLEWVEKPSQTEIQKLQIYRDTLTDPKKIAEVDAVIKASASAKGTNISLSMTQDKGINKNKTDLAGDVEQAALNAPDRIKMTGSVRNLVDKAFTGFGSDAGLKAAQVLEASGIAVKGTSESEQLDQLLNEMTIGTAGSLKGALSDKDREFVKQTIGTRGLTKSTLQYVADELERRARVDAALNKEVNDYKGNLNDFNFAEARSRAVKSVNERQAKEKRLRELERRAAGGQ